MGRYFVYEREEISYSRVSEKTTEKLFSYEQPFKVKSSTQFHVKTKILADFQIYISVPLTILTEKNRVFLNSLQESIEIEAWLGLLQNRGSLF